MVQVVRPVKVELIAFKSPLIIWFAVKVFAEVNFAVPFKLVSILDIFVPTLVVPYNKLVPAFIVGAVMVDPVLPVIVPELIAPVVILVVEFKSVPPDSPCIPCSPVSP